MKTTLLKTAEAVKDWYEVDADGKIMGRLAVAVAHRLMGKHKPTYTPHIDTGDFVIVVNVEKLVYSGNKKATRSYHFYSGYPGGTYRLSLGERIEKHPDRLFREAVRRMLPKSRLGRAMLRKLKVYTGPEHPHVAQLPKKLELK